MINNMKKLFAIALTMVFLISLCACGTLDPVVNPNPTPLKGSEEFDVFLNDLFVEEVTADTITLHYTLKDPSAYGIEHFAATYGDLDSTEEENRATVRKTLDEIKGFDYAKLNSEQQRVYDILVEQLQLNLTEGFDYYYSYLDSISGIQSNLPINFAEYQFYSLDDVNDYLDLLAQTKEFFDFIIDYEQKRIDLGLALSDASYDTAKSQCDDFTKVKSDNYLISTFNTRIDALDGITDVQKTDYKAKNKQAILEIFIPSYEKLSSAISQFIGSGSKTGGVNLYANGSKFYEYLVKSKTGTNKTMAQIISMLDKDLSSSIQEYVTLARRNFTVYENYVDNGLSYGITQPEEILEDLKSKINAFYPEITSVADYKIKYVEKALEETMSPAFYMIPPIDNYLNNVIYINNGSTDQSSLYSTLAHEGYPGHLYQTVYFSTVNKYPIRAMLDFNGYVEGWATYVELHSYELYDFGVNDAVLTTLAQLDSKMSLGISCRIDIGVNYEGWTVNSVIKYLEDNGFNTSFAQSLFDQVASSPATYLQYYVGYLQIMELQTKARTALGNKFDLKAFNKALLDIGPSQFDVIEKGIDQYIASAK